MAGVQTGKPSFERGIGSEPFAAFAEDSEASKHFNQAMSEGTRRDAPGIIASYDFGQFKTLVDVGGGTAPFSPRSLRPLPDCRASCSTPGLACGRRPGAWER